MNDPIVFQIILQIFLIALNAVFACAEIAIISMNDNKLAKLASQGDKRAMKLARLTSRPAKFLATIQVAITLSGFMGSAFAADNFSEKLVSWLVGIGVGIPVRTLDTIAVILITIILSYFTLVFGELVPKRVAMRKSEKLALSLASLISFISKVFAPIVWLLTASTNGVLRLLKIDPNEHEETASEEEIRMMVDVGSEKGTIDMDEKEMIQNVFEFDDITADEIATHRTEISVLWLDESMEEWEKTINESRHSVFPVCDESVDNVVGVIKAKDYFRLRDKSRENVIENAVKPAYFIPESLKADVLFRNMKSTKNHFAVVLDEYGGMSGIITVNDLVEQLVGEIDDEDVSLSEKTSGIERIDSKTWKIYGATPVDDVEENLSVKLNNTEYDTFGGLVFGTLGTIPEDGSSFELTIGNLIVKVLNVKEHRVEKAIVCVEEKPDEEAKTED